MHTAGCNLCLDERKSFSLDKYWKELELASLVIPTLCRWNVVIPGWPKCLNWTELFTHERCPIFQNNPGFFARQHSGSSSGPQDHQLVSGEWPCTSFKTNRCRNNTNWHLLIPPPPFSNFHSRLASHQHSQASPRYDAELKGNASCCRWWSEKLGESDTRKNFHTTNIF